MMWRALTIVCLLMLTGIGVAAQSGGDELSGPNLSYLVCDWGLLAIEHPVEPAEVFITITDPAAYSGFEGTSFTISGEGASLFEGNVVVEVSAGGEVVFSESTVLQAPEMGEAGTWSLDIDLGQLDGPTPITVTALSTSPADGSTVASAIVS